jgi:hypothetical protein
MNDKASISLIVASAIFTISSGVNAQLHVAPSGDVGLGTMAPVEALHLQTVDAKILVEETGGSATRTLMHLINPGRTHFKLQNTGFGSSWVFTNAGGNFFISLQGTGGPEFNILSNGNAELSGTLTQNSDVNDKTSITTISTHEILNLVAELPITRWEYKDALGQAHIGPMAQDFYAAFGLGANEKGISSIDTGGVALAAIKALDEKNKALEASNLVLSERVEALEIQKIGQQKVLARIDELEQMVTLLLQRDSKVQLYTLQSQ